MAVTLPSIKILLLEQGSMSSMSNNRILRGDFAPRFFGSLGSSHGRRGALLCASLGRSGCVPWEAAPGWSDDTCPLTCTKPSGVFFIEMLHGLNTRTFRWVTVEVAQGSVLCIHHHGFASCTERQKGYDQRGDGIRSVCQQMPEK